MGWHDSLASKARSMGKTSADFKAGAQRKANGTWMWLVLVAVVWYFASWKWALIPGAFAALSAFQSVSASMIAARLEKH